MKEWEEDEVERLKDDVKQAQLRLKLFIERRKHGSHDSTREGIRRLTVESKKMQLQWRI